MCEGRMATRFDAASRVGALEELFRGTGARRLTIRLEGPAAEISDRVILDLIDNRLVDAGAGARRGVEALTVLALSDAGTVEVSPIPPPSDRELIRFPDAIGLVRQAEVGAVELSQLLAHVGGLAAVPSADLDRLVEQLQRIPDAANVVLRLVDNHCTVGAILGKSPHDLRLTARILHRLAIAEVVVPPATVMPPIIEGPESHLGSPDEREGEAVEAEVGRWLSKEAAPESLLTEDAFSAAFAGRADAPEAPPDAPAPPAPSTPPKGPPEAATRARQTMPLTTKRPSPADLSQVEAPPEEDDVLRAAGVGQSNAPVWIGIAVAGVFLGVVASFVSGGEESHEIPDAGVVVAPVDIPDAGTSSVAADTASTAVELGPDGRPPIAGPDAPEDVRRAEAHLNAGRYQSARDLLDLLRQTRADDATVWILSGQLEVDLGRLSAADKRADRALELDPKSYRAWVLKGSVLQFRGRFKAARDAYRRAIRLGPSHPMTPEIESVLEQMERAAPR